MKLKEIEFSIFENFIVIEPGLTASKKSITKRGKITKYQDEFGEKFSAGIGGSSP